MAGDPVEQAYREGKFPASRRQHYYNLMAKRPKKTAKLLASLAAMLPPPGGDDEADLEAMRAEYAEPSSTAPVAAAASGPTSYPKDWLDRGGVIGRPSGVGGNIISEPSVGGAPVAAAPGEVL